MVHPCAPCDSSVVAENEEKGKFSTDIGADVIRAALESVKKAKGESEGVAVDVDAAVSDPGADSKEMETLRAQLELSQAKGRELMEKIKDTHEKMLRAVADLENFKKRAQKETAEVRKFGIESLLRDFLPVLDNLDRAVGHADSTPDVAAIKTGVEMVRKQFEAALGKHGVKGFSAVGLPFDPRMHEAMQQVVQADVPAGQVVSEVARGFTLNDRLVRPAMVVVAMAAPAAKTEEPQS
jgi:molecular chaperone GrpE